MAYTLQKIGKSLVKYFKPVRVTPPHYTTEQSAEATAKVVQGNLDDEGKRRFKLLKSRKPLKTEVVSEEPTVAVPEEEEAQVEEPKLPEHAPAQWVDLVVMLLAACKRASQKMRKRIALETYRRALSSRGRIRVRTVGSIINTTGQRITEAEEDEAA